MSSGSKNAIAFAILAVLGASRGAVTEKATPEPHRARASLPTDTLRDEAAKRLAQIDGSLDVPGLDSAVEVRRDRWGVPHIYAGTQHDLFFAQGFVAAQDRLWQMEMWRRQAEGRLSEVLGSRAVQRDRLARLFRYRGPMQTEWASYGPDAKAIVGAFVGGVNAYIRQVKDRPPIEFTMMGFAPEPWTADVPLARVTPLSGVSNATTEILRARLVSLVGVKETEAILPTEPTRALDPVPGLDLAGIDQSVLGGFGAAYADIAFQRIEGSNNWVVSGKKTRSGKPILANDPHRAITHPSVRYITHLVGPGWNVIGAGEPASPGVSIGHNERIAFGLTIVGMDQQDVYVERIRACTAGTGNRERGTGTPRAATVPGSQQSAAGGLAPVPVPRCYYHNGGWQPITTVIDTIRVKGDSARIVRLEFTHHGPIVWSDSAGGRAVAIRMVGQEPGTAAYLGSLQLGRARNWTDFQSAMARWKMPDENMIYADVDGNIGWIASGLMPRRSWSGLLPVPGDGRFEWSGFVPVRELPQAYNPPAGFIATANNNNLPPGYKTPIAYDWSANFRVTRIREVLSSRNDFTVEDFEALQHDDLSVLARQLVPALVSAAERLGHRDSKAVAMLASWNFRMSRDASAPLLFETWAPLLARGVNRMRLTPAEAEVMGNRADYKQVIAFLNAPVGAVSARARDSLVVGTLAEAATDVARRFGTDTTQWRWGTVHVAELHHPLARAFDLPPVSRAGDANTVFATGGPNYRQSSGASYREVIDLADFDNSVGINVPGQSAQPGSEYYDNLLPLWGSDRYFPLVYSRARVEAETKHVLRLVPARGNRE
jgi:penicillin amidase